MLNRRLYKIKSKYNKTNRFRSINIWARDESEIPLKLKQMDYSTIQSIIDITPTPTEKQISLATNLGYQITSDMTALDVSALISKKIDKDSYPPKYELMVFADNHDIVYSTFMGKKTLYNVIFNGLSDLDRYAFFIFCVYRYLSDDREANLDKSPHKQIFYSFANYCAANPKMEQSLIENYAGEDLRFFGTLSNGTNKYYGGSTQTSIYKIAKQYLIDNALIDSSTKNNKNISFKANDTDINSNETLNTTNLNTNINFDKKIDLPPNPEIDSINSKPHKNYFKSITKWLILGLIVFIVLGLVTTKNIGLIAYIAIVVYGFYKEIYKSPQ